MGLYGGIGKYDLQFFDKDGEQGDFFDAGVQGAYAHKIGKYFRVEYSLGVGYLQRECKKYDKVNDTMHGDIKDLFLKKFLEVVIDIVYSNPLKIFVFFFNKVSKCILILLC